MTGISIMHGILSLAACNLIAQADTKGPLRNGIVKTSKSVKIVMLCFLTQYEYALKKCQANKGSASFVKWVATNVMKQPET